MSLDNVSNNINGAMISGNLGLQRASNNITQTSFNIAQRSVESAPSEQAVSVNAAGQKNSELSTQLVSLSVNSNNAEASAKVLGIANKTVGTLLDILA